MRTEMTAIGERSIPELDDRIRLVGDSCLICGFAKPKGVWVGTNPEWYVCAACKGKVQRWAQVQELYRALLAFEDHCEGTLGHPSWWSPTDREAGWPQAHRMAKALDPFRYEDKYDDKTADAIEFLRERGYGVTPNTALSPLPADSETK